MSRDQEANTELLSLLRDVASGATSPEDAVRALYAGQTGSSDALRSLLQGNIREAREKFTETLEFAVAVGDDHSKATALYGLGRTLIAAHNNRAGLEFICDAFDAFLDMRRIEKALEVARQQGGFPYTPRALAMLNKAVELSDPGSPEHPALLSRKGIIQELVEGSSEESRKVLEESFVLASRTGDSGSLSLVAVRDATRLFTQLKFEESFEYAAVAVSYALTSEDVELIVTSSSMAAKSALVLGEIEIAERYIKILEAAARERKWPDGIFDSVYLRVQLLVLKGSWHEAISSLGTLEEFDDLNNEHRAIAAALIGLVYGELGELELATSSVSRATAFVREQNTRPNLDLLLMLGGHALQLNLIKLEEAHQIEILGRSWLDPDTAPALSNTALFSTYLTNFSSVEIERSKRALRSEKETSRDGVVIAARMWSSNHYRAIGYAAAGEWSASANEFEQTISQYQRIGFSAPLVWAMVNYCEMAARSGLKTFRQRSVVLLELADEAAQNLEMKTASSRIEDLRRNQTIRGTHQRGLTPRERDVLELLVQGMTNAEIAQTMVVSTNTVATHIKNLYTKLDVNNRSQAVVAGREILSDVD